MRTVNRQPFTSSELSASDVKYKYFNYTQWKGMCDDRNYLGVDQETFEDCNNVYIDADGVLRSRPALKILATNQGLKNIVDAWNFDILQAYKIGDYNNYKLAFVKDGAVTMTPDNLVIPNEFVLVLADEKIFMFAKERIAYYDINEQMWYDSKDPDTADKAKDTIYVPIVSSETASVVTDTESPNELTTAQIKSYIYNNFVNIDISNFVGSTVTIKVGTLEYTVNFTKTTPLVLVKAGYKFGSDAFVNDALGENGEGVPLIDATDKVILLSLYTDNGTSIDYRLYYSLDFTVFEYFDTINDAIHVPMLSKDSNFVVVFKSSGPFVKSLFATSEGGSQEFPVWTNLLASKNYVFNDRINTTTRTASAQYKKNVVIGGVFYDSNAFSFAYGINPITIDSDHKLSYANIRVISYNNGEVTSKDIASDINVFKVDGTATYSADSAFLNDINSGGNWEISLSTIDILDKTKPSNKVTANMNGSTIETYSSGGAYQTELHLVGTFSAYGGDIATMDETVYLERVTGGSNETNEHTETYDFIIDGAFISNKYSKDTSIRVRAIIKNSLTDGHVTGFALEFLADVMLEQYTVTSNQLWFRPRALQVEMVDGNVGVLVSATSGDRTWYAIYGVNNKGYQRAMYLRSSATSNPFREALSHDTQNLYCFYRNDDNNISKFSWSALSMSMLSSSSSYSISTDLAIVKDNYTIKASGDTYVLTPTQLKVSDDIIDLVVGANNYPLYVSPAGITYLDRDETANTIYTNILPIDTEIIVLKRIDGDIVIPKIDFTTELSEYYFVSGNKLLISATGSQQEVGEFKWYFPKINSEAFDYSITAIHPISTAEVAIFFKHAIYYVTPSEQGYRYYKSRIPLGCEYGSDIITTYDGKYTIFSTERGLVAMSYQDFVSATEQALTYLSDNIFSKYSAWNKGAIKITQFKFWLLLYRVNSNEGFVFDTRNASWWPVTIKEIPQRIFAANRELRVIVSKTLMYLDTSDDEYRDSQGRIEWLISSQKLHFNAIAYYKHITNITFNALSTRTDETTFYLNLVNYSDRILLGVDKTVNYKVDMITSYVKRLNYWKSNEFQFMLSSDDNADPIPLSLTNITIKYKITGQVR